jgi:hypothetical protein
MAIIYELPHCKPSPLDWTILLVGSILRDTAHLQDQIANEIQHVIRTLETASSNARQMIDYVHSPASRTELMRQSVAIDRKLETLRSQAACL